MTQRPRQRDLQDKEASRAEKEISRSLAQVLEVSLQLSPAQRQSGVVVVHADPSRAPAVVVGRTDRSARKYVTFNAKAVQALRAKLGATHSSSVDVAAHFRAVNPWHASVLVNVLPRVLSTIESVQKDIDEAQFREQVEALAVLVPSVEPTFDPRLGRVGEALRLQNEFMERELVLASADVAKHAGFSRRNPSHTASRWRKAGKIFSVSYRGKDYFPSFQFADDGQPWPLVSPLLTTLRTEEAMTDWDIALWFTTPNGWLSGQVPKALLLDPSKETAARLNHAAEQEVASDDE